MGGGVFCNKINDVSSTEVDRLKGSKENIQDQIDALEQKKNDFAETSSAIKDDLRGAINAQLGSSLITEETPIADYAEGVRSIEKGITTQNTKNTPGYVLAGGSNTNRVWGTDDNGNPGWRYPDNVANGQPVISTLTHVNQLNGLVHSHYKVGEIDTNYANTIGVTDNIGDFYVTILSYNGDGANYNYGSFILSSPRLSSAFYVVQIWKTVARAQRVCITTDISALNGIMDCHYDSFDKIPFDGNFRAGYIHYNHGTVGDPSSPIPNRTGDCWFNFLAWGVGNRRTYVAWSPFQDQNCVWHKIQHDSWVSKWYKISTIEIDTLKTDVANIKATLTSFENAKSALVNSYLGQVVGFTNSKKLTAMIADLSLNGNGCGYNIAPRARHLYNWLVSRYPAVKVIPCYHPTRKFQQENVEIQNKIKTLISSDSVIASKSTATFVLDYAYVNDAASASINCGTDYPYYFHSAAANVGNVEASTVVCSYLIKGVKYAGVKLSLQTRNTEPCVFVIGVKATVWVNGVAVSRPYNFLIIAL